MEWRALKECVSKIDGATHVRTGLVKWWMMVFIDRVVLVTRPIRDHNTNSHFRSLSFRYYHSVSSLSHVDFRQPHVYLASCLTCSRSALVLSGR